MLVLLIETFNMNKKQVLTVIKGAVTKTELVKLLQDNDTRVVQVCNAPLRLFIRSEELCRSCRVELVHEGEYAGSATNKVYYFSTRQLRVHQFFDSDSEDRSD